MPRYSREQVRQRQMTLGIVVGCVVLFIIGCLVVAIARPKADAPLAELADPARITEVRNADAAAMTVRSTPADAPARENIVADLDLAADEVLGIDVSAHQQEIDWQQVAADGYSFAILKATEGSGYTDPMFERNWEQARAAGLTVGAYHYFTLCSAGADQAEDFLERVPVDDAALPPALDLEFDGACDERPAAEAAQAEINAFVERVEEAWGRRVIIYSSVEWRQHYGLPVSEGRPDWLYQDQGRPEPEDWSVWQMRFDGTVSGIEGNVDIDVLRIEQLRDHSQVSGEQRREMQRRLDERLAEEDADNAAATPAPRERVTALNADTA